MGDEAIPATQVVIGRQGETVGHVFAVSARDTNDLLAACIDLNSRAGKVWLTSRTGEIRAALLTSTNGSPQVVPNAQYANEFEEQIKYFLAAAAESASSADTSPDGEGTVREISEKFGDKEVQELNRILNSAEFQASLTNYSCGDPVPKLKFSVTLRPKAYATTRAVEIYYSPGFSPSGRTRCLMFGVGFLLDKAVARLDPNPQDETTREPHCDCAKRDGKEEWVTFPGPDIILAPAKVAAKTAARKADEAEQEKEENLSVVHLDPSGVQVEPDTVNEHLVTREKSLGKLPPNADMSLFAIDPSFSHWACVAKRGGKQSVVLDGVEGKEYDEIPDHQQLVFSRDGKHFAYIAKRDGKMMTVVDGKEGKAYLRIEELFHPVFSPDGKRLAFIASKRAIGIPPETSFAVVDGQEQQGYDLVEGIFFSPESRHLAYNADKKWNRGTVLVVDGKEGKSYDQIDGGCFSPDGNRLAYVAYNRTNRSPESMGMDFAVVDGKEGKAYKSVSSLRFSPDSKHVAYVAGQGSSGMHLLVRDDIETKYRDLELGPFSPDSAHLACVGLFGSNWLVLIDGKKLDPQPLLANGDLAWSPVRDLAFSPNSRHLAYTSRGPGTNCTVVLDGKPIKTYEKCVVRPTFSPDGQRLAYVIERGGKYVPVFGGHEGNEYDRTLTWQSAMEDGAQILGLRFDNNGLLHAMAMRGGEFLRLEIELMKN